MVRDVTAGGDREPISVLAVHLAFLLDILNV
jgi:hypothetical protein